MLQPRAKTKRIDRERVTNADRMDTRPTHAERNLNAYYAKNGV